jgi:hypothetical protein
MVALASFDALQKRQTDDSAAVGESGLQAPTVHPFDASSSLEKSVKQMVGSGDDSGTETARDDGSAPTLGDVLLIFPGAESSREGQP